MKRLLAVVVAAAAVAGSARAQSPLADAARKAAEDRAKAGDKDDKKDAPKVITNGDLKKDPNAPATDAAPTEKPKADEPKAGAKKPPADKAEPKQTEAYWKRRATELHAKLNADEKTAAAEREKLDRLRRNIDACFGCRGRNQLESQYLRAQDDQRRLDDKVAAGHAAIQAFEEEGRRAGILPGWLRPE